MRNITGTFLIPLLVAGLSGLVGCGDSDGNGNGSVAGGSKQQQARAVVLALFDLVKGGQRAEAAGLIAYRGKDKTREWNAPYNYDNEDEKSAVARVFKRIEFLHMKGAPTFERFESETESEGEWLVWHVRFGEGEDAKKAAFACINNKGTMLLGDID